MNGVRTLEYPREMQGTTKLNDATAVGSRDDDTLKPGNDRMYVKSIRRLKHYNKLGDEVIDTYLCNNMQSEYRHQELPHTKSMRSVLHG